MPLKDVLQWHESSVLEKPEKGSKQKESKNPCNKQYPFKCRLASKQPDLKIHPKNPSHHPKYRHNKRRCCQQQLKLYQLVPNIILQCSAFNLYIHIRHVTFLFNTNSSIHTNWILMKSSVSSMYSFSYYIYTHNTKRKPSINVLTKSKHKSTRHNPILQQTE